jgi:hypothetical protein
MKIDLIIEKIDDKQAVLSDQNGRLINWPFDFLPADAKENDKITFSIGEDDNLAKNILNEILDEN